MPELTPDSTAEWWQPVEEKSSSDVRERAEDEQRRPTGLSFWALMAFTFILLLAPQERFPVLAPLRIALLSAGIAVLAHTLNRLSRGQPVIAMTPATAYLTALVGWAAITVPFSAWPGGSVEFLLSDYLKAVVIFLLLANAIDSVDKLKLIVWALALMAVPLAVAALSNYLAGEFVEGNRVVGYAGGMTRNPNDLALMLNLILPLSVALFLASQSATAKVVLGAVVCLLTAAIIITFSRAGFLALAVTAFCYAWRLRKRPERSWVVVALISVFIALPLVPPRYYERLGTIFDIDKDPTHSAQTRMADMKAALRVSEKNLLVGVGVGMSALAMNEERGETWKEIHNVYLQYLVELGVPGLLLFLLLYRHCFRATTRVLRNRSAEDGDTHLFHIAEGVRISLVAFAFAAFFHPVAYHFYFYYIASLAVAAGCIHSAVGSRRRERSLSHGGEAAREGTGSAFNEMGHIRS